MKIETYYYKKARYYDIINAYKFRETNEELEFFKRMFRKFNKKVKTILDVGCGKGRFSKPLSEMGFMVTGIDISKDMLDIARTKIDKRNKNVTFELADARTYKSKEKFDCALCGDSSLTHLLNKRELMKALSNINENLKEDGIFIFDVWNYVDYKDWKPVEKWTQREGSTELSVVRKQRIDSKGLYRWADNIKVNEGKGSFGLKMDSRIRFWKEKEWIKMFKDAGFKLVEAHSDLKHVKHYKGVPERLYFVAIK